MTFFVLRFCDNFRFWGRNREKKEKKNGFFSTESILLLSFQIIKVEKKSVIFQLADSMHCNSGCILVLNCEFHHNLSGKLICLAFAKHILSHANKML